MRKNVRTNFLTTSYMLLVFLSLLFLISTTLAVKQVAASEIDAQLAMTSDSPLPEVVPSPEPILQNEQNEQSDSVESSTEPESESIIEPANEPIEKVETPAEATVANTIKPVEVTVAPKMEYYDDSNREEVAVHVAKDHFSDSKQVIIVNRDKFPDAISATAVSNGQAPVLYTRAGRIDAVTLDQIKAMPLEEVVVLGGELSIGEIVLKQIQAVTSATINRIGGSDRYVVNQEAVRENFSTAPEVVIASGEIYTDALYGVPYALSQKAPILLTKAWAIPDNTVKLIKELGSTKVTIIGGEKTVNKTVESQLLKQGLAVNRLAGSNRYNGSALVAEVANKEPKEVIVTSGAVFSDALVAAPLAQKLQVPILLSRPTSVDKEVMNYFVKHKLSINKIHVLGGEQSASAASKTTIIEASSYLKVSVTNPYKVIEQQDIQMLRDDRQVIVQGKNGTTVSYYDLSFVNSKPVRQALIKSTNTPSVNQVEAVGSKARLTKEELRVYGQLKVGDIIEDYKVIKLPKAPNKTFAELSSEGPEAIYLKAKDSKYIITYEGKSEIGVYQNEIRYDQDTVNAFNNGVLIDHQTYSKEMLKLVNQLRVNLGLSQVQEGLLPQQEGTITRATEQARFGSIYTNTVAHIRPNGKSYKTAFPSNYRIGENLTEHYPSGNPYQLLSAKFLAEMNFNRWKETDYKSMINPDVTHMTNAIRMNNGDTAAYGEVYYNPIIAVEHLLIN